MRITVALLAISAGLSPVLALGQGWERLDGQGITAALTARVLGYPDGTLQDFFADGRTLYGENWGLWEVRDNRYCSQWPPSDRWDCYAFDRNGLDIRFTDEQGATTVGRYVDLQ